MKPFNDTYVMYQLLEFIDENSIICLCKASKKLNEICKQYIEIEDDKRFEIHIINDYFIGCGFFETYCRNNDVIKIRKVIERNSDWDYGLWGACAGGHMAIVKLMIEKGACWWNTALCDACYGGHIDIVKLLIEKGANDWNSGLCNACGGGHINIVKLMIEKGASMCRSCKKSMEEHLLKI